MLLYMYQVFSSLLGHLHFFVHFFLNFMEYFFIDHPVSFRGRFSNKGYFFSPFILRHNPQICSGQLPRRAATIRTHDYGILALLWLMSCISAFFFAIYGQRLDIDSCERKDTGLVVHIYSAVFFSTAVVTATCHLITIRYVSRDARGNGFTQVAIPAVTRLRTLMVTAGLQFISTTCLQVSSGARVT